VGQVGNRLVTCRPIVNRPFAGGLAPGVTHRKLL
jgi:hypothetical protein